LPRGEHAPNRYHRDVPGDGLATTDLVPPVIATPELEAGSRLGERYRLIARLGRGGGGTVWRVFDEKVGEELALKLLEGGTDLERWRREVALARRISHGNVCRVYDLGEAGGLRWVTMEWIEGESLRTLLQRGAIAEPERLMRQLVDGVAAIHAAGVVHRDLKPENIVVDAGGRAVIVDFGVARGPTTAELVGIGRAGAVALGAATGHGTVLGTPRYMAPEQAAGEVVDARSDVYALGLVLEEILTGGDAARGGALGSEAPGGAIVSAMPVKGAPGRGATTETSPTAVATTVDASPAALRAPHAPRGRARSAAGLPRPWGPVIARCTAPAAAERFVNAVAVREALAPRRTQRRLVIAGALIAVAAVGAVASIARDDRAAVDVPITQRRLTATADEPAAQPTSIAVSLDGKLLAYTVGIDVMMRAIDGGHDAKATMPTTFGGMPLARAVDAIGFLGDGRVVVQVLDRDHEWTLWAVGTGAQPQKLYRHDERMIAALSPRGDQLAVTTTTAGLFIVALAGGSERPLVAPRAGERFGGLAWSPDGTRVAFVRHSDDGAATLEAVAVARPATAVLARMPAADSSPDLVDQRAQRTAWPSEDRVMYVANGPNGAALLAVHLTAPAQPAVLVRWPEEHVGQIAWAGRRMLVLRGTAEHAIRVGMIDRRGYFLNLLRSSAEHTRADQLAGWTRDGRVVYGMDGNVVASLPFGGATVLSAGVPLGAATVLAAGRPDAVAGDAVVYHRGTSVRRVAVAGSDDRALADVAVDPGGDAVRCAGDREPPCVIAATDRTGVRYLRFDPATGARGDELYRAAPGQRLARSIAVSPDGATLAVVDGSSVVTLIARDGSVRRESLARSAEAIGVSWSHDGASLLIGMLGGGDDRTSVIRLWPGGEHHVLLHGDHVRYDRVREAPGGEYTALQTREVALDAWLIEGL
jgi:hypothetical protein